LDFSLISKISQVLAAGIVAIVLNLIIPFELEEEIPITSSVEEVDVESQQKKS
jgi:hypothetical protein